MRNPLHMLEIERIVLRGFDLTPYRAERIRALVEMELQGLLQQGTWPDGLTSSEVPLLHGPEMHMAEPLSDSNIACALGRSIAQTLNGMKGA